jgi:hypothetical protein
MKTSFVAFLNKHGIACASDTDMTLYALSRQEPIALAVNSYSPIPWDSIINAYVRQGEIAKHEIFGDYARDFSNYLSTVKINPDWKNLTEDDGKIFLHTMPDSHQPLLQNPLSIPLQLNPHT